MLLALVTSKNDGLLLEVSQFDFARGNAARNLGAGFIDKVRVVGVLPLDQIFNQVEQLGAFQAGPLFINPLTDPILRV